MDRMLQIVKQAAEAQRMLQEIEKLRREAKTYREIAEMFAVTIGLELGQRTLRNEMRRRCKNEYSTRRKLKRELRELWEKYKAGTISREEFLKREDEIVTQINRLSEIIEEKTKDLREKSSKIREIKKKIIETAQELLPKAGIEVRTITDVSEVPEWIRKLVEAPTISINDSSSNG